MTEHLYQAITCVRRTRDEAVHVYRCFRSLDDGTYSVQSMDVIRGSTTTREREQLENQFWELLLEAPPPNRSGSFGTLEEAISAFDAMFDD